MVKDRRGASVSAGTGAASSGRSLGAGCHHLRQQERLRLPLFPQERDAHLTKLEAAGKNGTPPPPPEFKETETPGPGKAGALASSHQQASCPLQQAWFRGVRHPSRVFLRWHRGLCRAGKPSAP